MLVFVAAIIYTIVFILICIGCAAVFNFAFSSDQRPAPVIYYLSPWPRNDPPPALSVATVRGDIIEVADEQPQSFRHSATLIAVHRVNSQVGRVASPDCQRALLGDQTVPEAMEAESLSSAPATEPQTVPATRGNVLEAKTDAL